MWTINNVSYKSVSDENVLSTVLNFVTEKVNTRYLYCASMEETNNGQALASNEILRILIIAANLTYLVTLFFGGHEFRI